MDNSVLVRGSLNTFQTDVTGGVIPPNLVDRDFRDWADSRAPNSTPLLTKIKRGATSTNRKPEWGQSYRAPVVTALGAALASGLGATELTVATGYGALYQRYDVLRITNYINDDPTTNRLNYSTAELVLVAEDDPDDTIIVARGQASSLPIAHHAGAHVEKVYTAMTENSNYKLNPVGRGKTYWNSFQRFQASVRADRAAQHTWTFEYQSNPLDKDLAEQQDLLKIQVDNALWSGRRQSGNANVPSMMGGVDSFITTNRIDCAGGQLSVYDLDDILADLWTNYDENSAKEVWMDLNTARIWDTKLNPYRQATMSDQSINTVFNSLDLRTGNYKINFARNVPPGKIFLLDFSEIEMLTYEGMDWQVEELPTEGPYDWFGVVGEFSMILKAQETMAVIENFDTDLNSYPRREFW